MKRGKNRRIIETATIAIALAAIMLSAFPAQAHIPEGWVPIEECSKYVGGAGGAVGGAAGSGTGTDHSTDFVYRAMGDAIANLWEGTIPPRSGIKIISKLPNTDAEQVIAVIVGRPKGDALPEWESDNPGEYEIRPPEGTSEHNLKPENFEFTFFDLRRGKEYVWKAEEEFPDIFPDGYFELRNKKAGGEELKWYEESQLADMEGKISPKLMESIGKRVSNELHGDENNPCAHHLDDEVVGTESKEGTLLYLTAKLAESGDKSDLEALRETVEEADELIARFHEVAHKTLPTIAEETGKGEDVAIHLHDGLGHSLMASIYRVGDYLDELEKIEDVEKVKIKASEMLEEAKKLKTLATEAHVHSTDPATVWTEQLPLKLKDGGETVAIKHSDLTTYLSQSGGKQEEEQAPIGGAISFTIIVVGIAVIGIVRYRRK